MLVKRYQKFLHLQKQNPIIMSEQISKALIGGTGLSASVIATNVEFLDPSRISDIGSLIVQIIITISTLIGLFKRKKGWFAGLKKFLHPPGQKLRFKSVISPKNSFNL